ncbi:MAG TPA: sigma 54-interacting transcriptional regulator [Desulfomonilaceae bacterium]|nr:sigma 54-interacting transcriptional regulator [Desulfomonilaceae bacterium]
MPNSTEHTRILIVDDEPSALEVLEMHLTENGFEVNSAVDGKGCIQKVRYFKPQIIILDVRLPDANGIDLINTIKETGEAPHIIVVTAFHDMATTVKAIKQGAFEYIPKPIDLDELDTAIERALELGQIQQRTDGLVINPADDFDPGEIIGKTKEMKEIFKTIGMLSTNRVTVLIEGETGTGKELVARAVHSNSIYKDEPFIAINCSAIVEDLLESDLFGHEKGAFTGAVALKKGKFEVAGNGTVLLDEIGEIPIELQAKLLRFLQDKEFQRVGGAKTLRSNARVIASTNRDLMEMVKNGRFRRDLYYRLGVAKISMPALRARKSDIPLMLEYLLKKINRNLDKRVDRVEAGALRKIIEHDWPGNVRELENFLVSAVIRARGNSILEEEVALILNGGDPKTARDGVAEERMQEHDNRREDKKEKILDALQSTHWHYGNACKILGISYPTLKKRIKAYGILAGGRMQEQGNPRKDEKEHILDALQSTHWHYGNACKILGISYPTLKKRLKAYSILPKPREGDHS